MFKHLKLLKLLAVATPAIVAVQPMNYAIFGGKNLDLDSNTIRVANSTQNNYVDDLANINSFVDYNPIYWDSKTPIVSTQLGTMGIDNAKQTIVLTAYNGGIIWANNLTNNTFVKQHYGSTDISSYTIKSWQKVYNKEQLLILFSSTTNTNGILVLLDATTGEVIANTNGDALISTVEDGLSVLFSTSDVNKYYVVNTENKNSATTLAKLTQATLSDNSITSKTIQNAWTDANWDTRIPQFPNYDYFLGWIPGKIGSNVNFAFFYSTKADGGAIKNIYVTAINDEFQRIPNQGYGTNGWAKVNTETTSIEINFSDNDKWQSYNKQFLYFGDRNQYSYSKNTDPNIYLIFNYTTTNGTTTIPITKLTDFTTPTNADGSYKDKIYITSNGNKIPNTYTLATTVNELSSISSSNSVVYYTTKKISNKEVAVFVAPNNIATMKRKTVNTFDGAANTHKKTYIAPIANYASQIGESNTSANDIGFVFSNPNLSGNTVYLYSGYMPINSENYTQQQAYTPEFHKFNDVDSELKNSNLKDTKLASNVTNDDIKPYLKFKYANQSDYQTPKENYTITPSISNADDSTGSLSYSYNIEFTTEWNQKSDSITYPNSFTISGDLTSLFYKLTDFNFKFVTSASDDKTKWEKIQELKRTKIATDITKKEILDYFIIQDNILDKNGDSFTIDESMIEITSNTNTTTLEIKINLPADKFPTLNENLLIQKYEEFGTASLEFDWDILSTYPNVIFYNDTQNALIDLTNNAFENINNTIYVDDFVNGINTTYKDSILKLFSFNGYTLSSIVKYSSDYKTGKVVLKASFTKQNGFIGTDQYEYTLTFKGLKVVDKNVASVTLNQDVISQSNISITDNVIDIDITNMSFGNIDNTLTLEDFTNGISNYIPTLTMLFVANGYNTPVYLINNSSPSSIQLEVTFNKNESFTGQDKIQYTININGFYVKPTSDSVLEINKTYIDSNNAITFNEKYSVFDIDLSKNNLGDINNGFYSEQLIDDLNKYENSILNLFTYNSYSYKMIGVNNDNYLGTATVKITFTNNNDLTEYYTYTLNFTNFALKHYIDVNQEEVSKNDNVSYEVVDPTNIDVTIDVSQTKFYSINSQMDASAIVNDFSLYESDILSLIDYSPEDYSTTVNPIYDENNNVVNVDIIFTLKNSSSISLKATTNKPQTFTVRVKIVGFKQALIATSIMIAAVVLIALIALIIAITTVIMIKKGKRLNLRENKVSKKILSKK